MVSGKERNRGVGSILVGRGAYLPEGVRSVLCGARSVDYIGGWD